MLSNKIYNLYLIKNSQTAYGDHVMGLPILGSIYNI